MKKLFTLKNCLIVVLLLSVIAFFIAHSCLYIDNVKVFNAYIANIEDTNSSFLQSYIISKNICLSIIITNFAIVILSIIFLLLLFSRFFDKYNCLNFATISLIFINFSIYMLQISIQFFLQASQNSHQSFTAIAITALITMLVSISCYVYLLVREIQKRKRATQTELQEHITEETTQN